MKLIGLSQAAEEFESAVAHYEDKQAGLGQRFRKDIPRLRPGGYRRVNLKVFPHYIAYFQIGEAIWILAIAHGHREPEYWIDRKRDVGQDIPPNDDLARRSAAAKDLGRPPSEG